MIHLGNRLLNQAAIQPTNHFLDRQTNQHCSLQATRPSSPRANRPQIRLSNQVRSPLPCPLFSLPLSHQDCRLINPVVIRRPYLLVNHSQFLHNNPMVVQLESHRRSRTIALLASLRGSLTPNRPGNQHGNPRANRHDNLEENPRVNRLDSHDVAQQVTKLPDFILHCPTLNVKGKEQCGYCFKQNILIFRCNLIFFNESDESHFYLFCFLNI